ATVTDANENPPNPVTSYTYTPVGNLEQSSTLIPPSLSIPFSRWVQNDYHYDPRNRLTDMGTTWTDINGQRVLAVFGYNPAGRPLHVTGARMAAREHIYASTTINRTVDYYYDSL